MSNYKTRLPGVDRSSEAKNPGGQLKSSALQKVGEPQGKIMSEPAKYNQAPLNFMPGGGGIVGKIAGALAPGAMEKVKKTKVGGIASKLLGF